MLDDLLKSLSEVLVGMTEDITIWYVDFPNGEGECVGTRMCTCVCISVGV